MPGNNVTDEMVERAAVAIAVHHGKNIMWPAYAESARSALEAALTDHVVVPREPTPAMLRAGVLADEGCDMPGFVYRAMIAAAPPTPAKEVG